MSSAQITERPATTPALTRGGQAAGTNLRRLRWAVRATLSLGVAVSVAANVLHAQPHLISQAIAAWPPLALLLTVELISRVPTYRRSLAAVRLVATAAIAGIAAWISYWHMAGVAARYGETGASAFLLPLSVDGLVIVASVSLVEIAGQINAPAPPQQPTQNLPTPPATVPLHTSAPAHGKTGLPTPPVTPSPLGTAVPIPVTAPAPATPSPERPVTPTAGAASVVPTPPVLAVAAPAAQPPPGPGAPEATAEDLTAPDTAGGGDTRPPGSNKPGRAPTDPVNGSQNAPSGAAPVPSPDSHADDHVGAVPNTVGPPVANSTEESAGTSVDDGHDDRSVPSETAAAVAYWHRRDPDLHPAEIGARIARSERTVRRYWPRAPDRSTDPDHGHRATVRTDTSNQQ